MDQPQDETLTCSSCGSTFIFAAADAAARAERGITTPPAMCKPCWRAQRSSQGPGKGAGRSGDANDAPPPRAQEQRRRGNFQPRAVRYTGDVNEYRSPMPDPHFATYTSYGRPAAQPPRARPHRDEGRSFGPGPRGPRGRGFPITCAACGVAATVPFRPADGQKVYCRACFQAEKPS